MRYFSRAVVLALTFLVAAPMSMAMAADIVSSGTVIIRSEVTSAGDLYASGVRVLIQGTLDGDLVAVAADEIVIEGLVTGDVITASPLVVISGRVDGSVRAAGGRLELTGQVGGDVVGINLAADLASGSEVLGDVFLWTRSLISNGSISGDLSGNYGALELGGTVSGNVDVTVGQIEAASGATVGGDLGYRSDDDASGLGAVDVGGVTVRKSMLPSNIRIRALFLLARALIVLILTAVATLIAWLWPQRLNRAAQLISEKPLRSAGRGLLILLAPLALVGGGIAIAVVGPSSAAVPLLALMVPIGLAILGALMMVGLVAGAPAVLALGRTVLRSRHVEGGGLLKPMLLGALFAAILWLLPAVGWIFALGILVLGLGGWTGDLRSPQPV